MVDIFGIVYEMRKERVWMVQTEQQYICIHQVRIKLKITNKALLLPTFTLVLSCYGFYYPHDCIKTMLLQCLLSVLEGKEHEERLAMELHHNEAFEDDEGIAESGM